MHVPFVDLKAQYQSLRDDIGVAINHVFEGGVYANGPNVTAFEREFADYVGTPNAIGCANGSDALELVFRSWGTRAGDEIIVPANAWITAVSSATMYGAKPVFVDVDEHTGTLDPVDVERKITFRTKAIVVVHTFGVPADMDAILRVARPRGIRVLEDCAQSLGARIDGHQVGTIGAAATFSFRPDKTLGAYGDGGAIVVNRDEDAELLRRIGHSGQAFENDHRMEGRNSRLDELQAAVLRVKLRHLDDWVDARRRHAARYRAQLAGLPLTLPTVPKFAEPSWQIFAIRVEHRDGLREALAREQIETHVHYPVALPFVPAYAYLRHTPEQFPVAYARQSTLVSLPMYAELSDEQIDHVCAVVRGVVGA